MTALEKDILKLLTEDARLSAKKLAAMLSADEELVKETIADLEKKGVIVKYSAIVNSEKAEDFKQIFSFDFAEKREIGPIVGAHGGPNCVGLAFFEKVDEKA